MLVDLLLADLQTMGMRINRYIAVATGLSRRKADLLIQNSKVYINGLPAQLSDHATAVDIVKVDGKQIFLPPSSTTIFLNKPTGYVCSRDGQGSHTVYDLLPKELLHVKPVGRLDKDSSGLLVMTDDGQLAHELTHPKFAKDKIYDIELNISLKEADFKKITRIGVDIGDGKPSQFDITVEKRDVTADESTKAPNYYKPLTTSWRATLSEGRNRQIRRTFSALNYTVKKLHRIQFGGYSLGELPLGKYKTKP